MSNCVTRLSLEKREQYLAGYHSKMRERGGGRERERVREIHYNIISTLAIIMEKIRQ